MSAPAVAADHVVLPDGAEFWVRPLERTDGPLLIDGFNRMTPESRRMRFLISKRSLSAADLRVLTAVDARDHVALVAVDADGRGLGVIRYIRWATDPTAADLAITVVDEWHGRGVGAELFARLSTWAYDEGIRRFTASVSGENIAVPRLLRRLRVEVLAFRRTGSEVEYELAVERHAAQLTAQPAA